MTTIKQLIDNYKSIQFEASNPKWYLEAQGRHINFRQQLASISSPHDEIAESLRQSLDNPCQPDLNLWLEAAEIHPSLSYLSFLCELLEQEMNCLWHEGIISALEKLNNERAIPALKRAILHNLNYENTRQVAVAAMEALAKIGTEEAIQVLEVCRKYPDNLVRRSARDILKAIKTEKSD